MLSFSVSMQRDIDIKRERRNVANSAMGIASIIFFTSIAQIFVALSLAIVVPDLLSSTLVSLIINAITMYGVGMPMSMVFFRKCDTRPIREKPLGVGAMILTKLIGTLGFVIPHFIRQSNMKFRHFVLYSLFEPVLLASATGMVCYWQYYFLRGQMHEFFLLALAGISGVLIYFPALYFMMFDHAERLRTKKLFGKFTAKLRRN